MRRAATWFTRRSFDVAQVRHLLGHASITTMEPYDNQKLETFCARFLDEENRAVREITVRLMER